MPKPKTPPPCDGPCTAGLMPGEHCAICGKATMPELTEDQWAEVWYALDYKLTSPAVATDAAWRYTIEEIKTLIEAHIPI